MVPPPESGTATTSSAQDLATLSNLTDFVTPMALRVAVTLRVADFISLGHTTLESLIAVVDAHPRMLRKLLDHLCFVGVLRLADDSYELTGVGSLLVRDRDAVGITAALDLAGVTGKVDMAIIELLHAVRTGETVCEGSFGEDVWQHLDSGAYTDASMEVFSTGSRVPELEFLVEGFDWSSAGRVVDVGGNTGAVVQALLDRYATLCATLIDLPCFTRPARQRLARFGERCEVRSQSFFDPLPDDGDVYLLSAVLSDWPAEKVTRILRNCAHATAGGGRVVVSELHLTGELLDPAQPTRTDLFLAASVHAPDRPVEEITELADAAGLEHVATNRSYLRSILEFRCR